MLKTYDKIIADNMDPPLWWARDDAVWLKSQSRKQAMQHWHLPEYWRKHGFPPQCRPIGELRFRVPLIRSAFGSDLGTDAGTVERTVANDSNPI
jgi:hypothetical protein